MELNSLIGTCSKYRKIGDEIPENEYGIPYEDKYINCIKCLFEKVKLKNA
jgi:hypothetical protein